MNKKRKSARKKGRGILSESTIRRWSKIAGTPINERKIREMRYLEKEEEYPEEDEYSEDEMGYEDEEGMDFEDEIGGEEEPMEMGGGDEQLVQDLVSAIADAIEDVSGVPVNVNGGTEEMPPAPEEEIPPAPEEEMPEEEPMVEEKEEEKLEEKEEESLEENESPPTDGGFNLNNDPGGKKHRKGVGKDGEMPDKPLKPDSVAKFKSAEPSVPNPVNEQEEDLEEDGRGRSGDAKEVDRKPKGSGRRPAEVNALEEDDGADWKGKDQEWTKAKEVEPEPMYEVSDKMVAAIAKRVAAKLLEEKKQKKTSLKNKKDKK